MHDFSPCAHRLVQALTSEADKAAVKLATLLDEANAFESNTKLSLRSGLFMSYLLCVTFIALCSFVSSDVHL